jgi:hypothetical protein
MLLKIETYLRRNASSRIRKDWKKGFGGGCYWSIADQLSACSQRWLYMKRIPICQYVQNNCTLLLFGQTKIFEHVTWMKLSEYGCILHLINAEKLRACNLHRSSAYQLSVCHAIQQRIDSASACIFAIIWYNLHYLHSKCKTIENVAWMEVDNGDQSCTKSTVNLAPASM